MYKFAKKFTELVHFVEYNYTSIKFIKMPSFSNKPSTAAQEDVKFKVFLLLIYFCCLEAYQFSTAEYLAISNNQT